MPQKLETVLKHVEEIGNNVNRQLIKDYYRYLVSRDSSTKSEEKFDSKSDNEQMPSNEIGENQAQKNNS
jgi:hypothetical protein